MGEEDKLSWRYLVWRMEMGINKGKARCKVGIIWCDRQIVAVCDGCRDNMYKMGNGMQTYVKSHGRTNRLEEIDSTEIKSQVNKWQYSLYYR